LGFAASAPLGEEPVDQLVTPRAGHDRRDIGEDGRARPLERDPAAAGDQRIPASSRSTVTCSHARGPSGVAVVALSFRAILRYGHDAPERGPDPVHDRYLDLW
jgi:hypothetical protein